MEFTEKINTFEERITNINVYRQNEDKFRFFKEQLVYFYGIMK